MNILISRMKSQHYAARKDIAKIFGYSDPTRLLKAFRDYADENPTKFEPYTPYVKQKGMHTLYDIICFAYFFEHKDLLEAGTRSITFTEELPRLKEVFG